MNATDIIGYTYEADYHCIDCSVNRFGKGVDLTDKNRDSNGLLYDQTDSDGETLYPVFGDAEGYYDPDTDKYIGVACGDCFEYVIEPAD